MGPNQEKLTICFHPWMLYFQNDDYETAMDEIADRGFNCIRIDDGAGLLWDGEGKTRHSVAISPPFGSFTKFTTFLIGPKVMDLWDRLLRIFAAAKKRGVKVILSSWFFLHTNWFCEENDVRPLFALSTEEKIDYFAKELSGILDVLRKEGYIGSVAYAEIFNEFDGLPFAGEYRNRLSEEEADRLRVLHEKAIAKCRARHPDVLFAFDTWRPGPQEAIIPRNIDVLDFHFYYAWPVYFALQRDIVQWTTEEPEIPEDIRYYLKEKPVSVAEVVKEMKTIRTGLDWPRRISLYASIDEKKEAELSALLDRELTENYGRYLESFYAGIDRLLAVHEKTVPDSRIVMGEGVSCCASPIVTFERDSGAFWKLIGNQMAYFNRQGFWGSVVATTHAPERTPAWSACRDLYREVNGVFLGKE